MSLHRKNINSQPPCLTNFIHKCSPKKIKQQQNMRMKNHNYYNYFLFKKVFCTLILQNTVLAGKKQYP